MNHARPQNDMTRQPPLMAQRLSLHTVCPLCHAPYVLDEALASHLFTCTTCGEAFTLPDAPARPPSPLQVHEQYRRVVGERPSLLLVFLGIATLDEDMEEGGIKALWNLRHLLALLALIAVMLVFVTTADAAKTAGPVFTAATVLCFITAYAMAVRIGRRQIGRGTGRRIVAPSRFATLVVHPLMIFVGDAEAVMPVARALFFAICLSFASLLVGTRAGSLGYLFPHMSLSAAAPRQASAQAGGTQGSQGGAEALPSGTPFILENGNSGLSATGGAGGATGTESGNAAATTQPPPVQIDIPSRSPGPPQPPAE
jgi:hypothetical protein